MAEAFAHAGKSDSASECTLSGVRWSVVEGGERHLVCHFIAGRRARPTWVVWPSVNPTLFWSVDLLPMSGPRR